MNYVARYAALILHKLTQHASVTSRSTFFELGRIMLGSFLALTLLLSSPLPLLHTRDIIYESAQSVVGERESDVVAFAYNSQLLEVQIRIHAKL